MQQPQAKKRRREQPEENQKGNQKKGDPLQDRGIEPDVNRTRNLLIWSQTRYHCATDPVVIEAFVNISQRDPEIHDINPLFP